MIEIDQWKDIAKLSSAIKSIFEKGGGIIFPEKGYFSIGLNPFLSTTVKRVFDEFSTDYSGRIFPYIIPSNENIARKLFFFSERELFLWKLIVAKNIDMILVLRTTLQHISRIVGKVGLINPQLDSTKNLLNIVGGIMICFPISENRNPIYSQEKILQIGTKILEDYFFIKILPEKRGFPTFIEIVADSVKINYEGTVRKADISENFALKII